MKLLIGDVLSFLWEVVAPILAILAAIALVIGGVVGLVRWNVLVTCDHWEEVLDRPTRLDTWGPGCVVELDDGTEIPVHQVHEFTERDDR